MKKTLNRPQAGLESELDIFIPNPTTSVFCTATLTQLLYMLLLFLCRYIFKKSDFPCEIISSKCFQFDFLRNSCQSISPPDAALTFSSLLIKARNHEWQYCQSYFSEIPERILCPWQYPWIQCYICRGEEISHGQEDAECSLCAWYASLQHGT